MTNRKLRRVLWGLAVPACLLFATASYGHPGHADALTTRQAVARGKAIVRSLVKKDELVDGRVLDESWNEIDGRGKCSATPMFYLVSLDNYAAGKTIHLLLNHSGRFLRARFDANFAELKFSSFPLVDCGGR